MLTSQQISGLINSQMSGFSNMQQSSLMLGAQAGLPIPMMPQGGGFNYGGMPDPYGGESAARMGVAGVSAVSKAVPTAMAGLGLLGGFGLLGKASGAASMLDPFVGVTKGISVGARAATGTMGQGFFAAGRGMLGSATGMGRFAMGGLAGGAIAALPYYAAYKGLEFAGRNLVQGAQQEHAIQQTLRSNFDFYNPASTSGRGFTADQRDVISNTVRGMAETDPFADMGELTRILGKASRTGTFTGMTDANNVARKFKELTSTLKKTAKILGTTMEDAMEFFESSKRMGFYTKTDILKNAVNAQVMSGGGLSARGIMQAQAQGAAVARAQGYTGRQGAVLAARSVQQVRDMVQAGALSQEDLREMSGGLTGQAAYRAVGRQMQQASYSLARSGIGRALYAAMAETTGEGGERRFTGKIDKRRLQAFLSGQYSAGDIRSMASRQFSGMGREGKLSFLNMEKDIAGEFAAQGGAGGWMGVMGLIKAQRPGLGTEAIKKLMTNMTGMGRRQVEYLMKMYENRDEINRKNLIRTADLLRKRSEKEFMARNYTMSGIMRQLGHGLAQYTTMPLQRAGAGMSRWFRDLKYSLTEKMMGRVPTSGMGNIGREMLTLEGMGEGGRGSLQEARQAISGMGGLGGAFGGPTDLTGGLLPSMFGTSAGAQLAGRLGQDTVKNILQGGGDQVRLTRGGGAWGFGIGATLGGLLGTTLGGFGIAGGAYLGGITGRAIGNYISPEQSISQAKLRVFQETKRNAREWFTKNATDLKEMQSAANDLTVAQLKQIQDAASGDSAESYNKRVEEFRKVMSTGLSGAQSYKFNSMLDNRAKAIASRMGKQWNTLSRDERIAYRKNAADDFTRIVSKKGALMEALGTDPAGGIFDADGMIDSVKFAKKTEQFQEMAASKMADELGLSKGSVSRILKDEKTFGQLRNALQSGPAGRKARRELWAASGKGSDMRSVLEAMSKGGEDRLTKMRQMIRPMLAGMGAQTMQVAVDAMKRLRRQALGGDISKLRRADADIAELMTGEGGVLGMMKGLTVEGWQKDPSKYQAIISKQLQIAEAIRQPGKGEARRALLSMGQLGQNIASASRLLGKRSAVTKLMEAGDLSGEQFLGRLGKITGFNLGEGTAFGKKLLEYRQEGGTEKILKALATERLTAQKQQSTSIMTALAGNIEKMTQSTAQIADLMLVSTTMGENERKAYMKKHYKPAHAPKTPPKKKEK